MMSDIANAILSRWNSSVSWWNSLTPENHLTVYLGLIVAIIGAAIIGVSKFFGKSIKGIFTRNSEPQPPPSQKLEITVNTSQPTPPQQPLLPPQSPEKPAPLPLIPRSSASVDFVPRFDAEGRDLVLRIQEELSPEKNQLVILWGPGGVGKTTLAIEARRGLENVFGQRIVWTSADGRSDYTFSALLDEITSQLGQPDIRQLALEPKKDAVRSLITEAPTLVVLDNFETISPEEQSLCTKWLAQYASCPVLITTRDRVDIGRNISVDVMSPDEAQQFVVRLIQESPTPEVFAHLDRELLINTADRTPLVLEWIVAQIELAQEPQAVLDELTHGKGEAARRVFDRSFSLPRLGDDGRATLLALSLFVPSASRPALAEVAGLGEDEKRANEAVKCMAELRLVRPTNNGQRLAVTGLTRELTKARLFKDPQSRGFQQRFVAFFLGYAESHGQIIAEDFDALEMEKDNLLGAVDVAFGLEDWKSVVRIRSSLEEFLDLRGHWGEAIERGGQALKAANTLGDQVSAAKLGHNVGIIYQKQGELEEARRLYEENLEIEKELGNQRAIASGLHQLGRLAQDQRELEKARGLYEESLAIKKELGDQRAIALTVWGLGNIALEQKDFKEAREQLEQALSVFQDIEDLPNTAGVLHQLGMLAQDQGELEEARRLYEKSLAIEKDLGNQSGIAESLRQLGLLAEKEEATEEAVRCFREALNIFEKLGSPYAEQAREALQRVEGK